MHLCKYRYKYVAWNLSLWSLKTTISPHASGSIQTVKTNHTILCFAHIFAHRMLSAAEVPRQTATTPCLMPPTTQSETYIYVCLSLYVYRFDTSFIRYLQRVEIIGDINSTAQNHQAERIINGRNHQSGMIYL